MCLGIPMRVQSLDGFVARCEAKGAERDVHLFMLQHEPLAPGDYVVVHLGYATEKVTEADALAAWAIYEEILAAEDASAAI